MHKSLCIHVTARMCGFKGCSGPWIHQSVSIGDLHPDKPCENWKPSESQNYFSVFVQKLFKHNLILYEGCQQAGLSANKRKEIEVRKQWMVLCGRKKDKHESNVLSDVL